MKNKKISILLTSVFLLATVVLVAEASHSWGRYHWDLSTAETTADPLDLGNNLSAEWQTSLLDASLDWNLSVLKNEVAFGGSNANCDPTSGRVEICNGEYGYNGWLGIASIWVTRGKNAHITQAIVKLNDTYFSSSSTSTSPYDTPAWRNFVMCQEVGHTFGLDHQDENFYNANLGTCMDYTNDPDGTIYGQLDNQHPNQHDYDELSSIYAHLNDGSKGSGNGKGGGKKPKNVGKDNKINLNDPRAWGEAIKKDAQGKNSLYKRNLNNGETLITHVFWAE